VEIPNGEGIFNFPTAPIYEKRDQEWLNSLNVLIRSYSKKDPKRGEKLRILKDEVREFKNF